jgi:hypothetical protein
MSGELHSLLCNTRLNLVARHLRMHLCDWTNRDARFAVLRRTIDKQSNAGNRRVSVICNI